MPEHLRGLGKHGPQLRVFFGKARQVLRRIARQLVLRRQLSLALLLFAGAGGGEAHAPQLFGRGLDLARRTAQAGGCSLGIRRAAAEKVKII